jgi:hypothetical protein
LISNESRVGGFAPADPRKLPSLPVPSLAPRHHRIFHGRYNRFFLAEIARTGMSCAGLQLVTKLKKKMKNRLLSMFDKIMLRKRAIIESVIDQLKNISNIEHSRHRSVANCFVNLVAGLVAYTYREKKPSLNIRVTEQLRLPVLVF